MVRGRLNFKEWLQYLEAIARLPSGLYVQGEPPQAREPSLFEPEPPPASKTPEYDTGRVQQFSQELASGLCSSGFDAHAAKVINPWAQADKDNLALTIIFASLTANRNFTTVFGYFPILASILKNGYESEKPKAEDLWYIAHAIGTVREEIHMLINQDVTPRVAAIWGDRPKYFAALKQYAAKKDWYGMLHFLVMQNIGLGHVKAAFAIQLIFGELACIDAHNARIYGRVGKIGMGKAGSGLNLDPQDIERLEKLQRHVKGSQIALPKTPEGTETYYGAVQTLAQKFGVGSKQAWDIWTDYVVRQPKSLGQYASGKASLNPQADEYQKLLGLLYLDPEARDLPLQQSILTGDPAGWSGSQAHIAAMAQAKHMVPGAEMDPAMGGEDWRGAVPKFLGARNPAAAEFEKGKSIAQMLMDKEGIERLIEIGKQVAKGAVAKKHAKVAGGELWKGDVPIDFPDDPYAQTVAWRGKGGKPKKKKS